jgi:hypothetical protein
VMKWGILIFAFVCVVFFLFATYMAFFRDWGSKHYLVAKKYPFTPFYLLALLGERFYIICYKVGIIIALISTTALCIFVLTDLF